MKVVMVMATTLDGKIAKHAGHFPNWTSKEDKQMFAKYSKQCGVIILGKKTFDTLPSPLKERLNVVFTREKNLPQIEGVRWVSGEPEDVLRELEKEGYKEVILGGGATINDLFLEKKLIDEIMMTVEPKIFGAGLSLFSKPHEADLELIEMKKINNNSILLRYKVIK